MIERIRQWTDESDRAVSPVIGVILMVAITVILAAVIGSFVLGLGEQLGNSGPSASFSVTDADPVDQNGSAEILFRLTYNNGPSLKASGLNITVSNASSGAIMAQYGGATSTTSGAASNVEFQLNGNSLTNTDTLTAGDVLTLTETSSSDSAKLASGNEYRIVIVDRKSGSTIVDTTIELE